ncbi:MAG: hypothetical protein JSV65_09100 [Armatimonadota bacterium]|nr:MAG: hypothetical protein JSV65_09100 [Armatimonadota bacterium]
MRAYLVCALLLLSAASLIPMSGCGSSDDIQAILPGDFRILAPGRSWTYDGTYWAREITRATAEYSGSFILTRACTEVDYAGQPALRVATTVSDVTGDRPAMAQDLAGTDYFVLQSPGYYAQAHQTPGGSLEVYNPPRLWMPVPLTRGQTWTWVENWFGTDTTATCTVTGVETEDVPAGTFDAAQLSAGAQASGVGNWLQYTWVRAVAPDIGVVRETKTSSQTLATGEQIWAEINLDLHNYSDTYGPPTP